MGKTKSKQIRRAVKMLVKKGVKPKDSFTKNKKTLEGLETSKKIRNQIAGLLTRTKKQEKPLTN